MTDLPYLKFYLIDSLTNPTPSYFTVNSAGAIVLTQTPTEIEAPLGWMDTEIKWSRSMTYLGIIRSLTTPYQFVMSAAKIARHLYATRGIEAECYLRIDKRGSTAWTYTTLATFGLDFSTYSDTDFNDDTIPIPVVKINAIEDGIYKKLIENESTPYEIGFDSTAKDVYLDGVLLDDIYNFAPSAGLIHPSGAQSTIGSNFGFITMIFPQNVFYKEDSVYNPAVSQSNLNLEVSGNANGANQPGILAGGTMNTPYGLYMLEAKIDMDVFLEMNTSLGIYIDAGSAAGLNLNGVVYVVDVNQEVVSSQIIYNATFAATGVTVNHNINATSPIISVLEGERLYFCYEFYPLGGSAASTPNGIVQYGNPSTSIDYYFKWHTAFKRSYSTSKAYRYHQLYEKIGTLLTDGLGQSYSDYLQNAAVTQASSHYCIPYYTMVTCGDALRQLAGAKIKTSLKDLFKDAKTRWCMGLGIDSLNRIRLEPLYYFFDRNTFIYDLGEVNAHTEPASEFFFQLLNIGYQDISYDEINGRNEYNAGHTYKLPFTRNQQQEDFISPYRADCYGVEYQRANIIKKQTINTDDDNDIFLLQTTNNQTNGAYNLDRPTTLTGVPYPTTVFNVGLSPKHNLYRNAPLLGSICDNRLNKFITFQKADKNASIIANFPGDYVDEDADLAVTSVLNEQLFKPVLFKFTTEVPDNIQTLLQAPYGYFTFTHNGHVWKGFLMTVTFKPVTNAACEWTFLSHPANVLTNLVS